MRRCSGEGDRAGDDAVSGDGAGPDVTASTDSVDDTVVDAPDDGEGDGAADGEGWTVLVYSIADTRPRAVPDGRRHRDGQRRLRSGVDIVGLVDRASDYSSDPVLGVDDWQGGKLLHVQQGGAEVLADLGDVNTGDPQVLADFIATGITQFPAARYSLVISDHGASWPGVGGDESAGHDTLTLAELDAAIAAGLDAAVSRSSTCSASTPV